MHLVPRGLACGVQAGKATSNLDFLTILYLLISKVRQVYLRSQLHVHKSISDGAKLSLTEPSRLSMDFKSRAQLRSGKNQRGVSGVGDLPLLAPPPPFFAW
jgi:hypothetical protein